MKIVCDDKIPYIREALASLTDDEFYKEGGSIAAADVHEADALIVRTRTRCDQALLQDSRVQLVVTATIGYDHIDTEWLESAGIAWTNCPGCNATSVAQWVRNSLLATDLHIGTLGIVGYGHVGRAVAATMRPCVERIVVNDPPLSESGLLCANDLDSTYSLGELAAIGADAITFHTPLTLGGKHPTLHLADQDFFDRLARPTVIINAARGGVVDEAALLRAMDRGIVTHALIDTWEGEPHINPELLHRAAIATPHIAGYSADGKANASRMVVEAIARHFGLEADTSAIVPPTVHCNAANPLALYDPRTDSAALKADPNRFEWLRGHYPVRREIAQNR